MSKNALRKTFNTVGLGIPAIMFCLMTFAESNAAKIFILTIAGSANHFTTTGGYFLSHSDVAGSFGGILFGICNTIGMFSGFINPLIIAALAPNVSNSLIITVTKNLFAENC